MSVREYTHLEPGLEVEGLSGHYTVDKEIKLEVGEREVLIILGSAMWDKSCCGIGGCRFATIPGYIVDYKARTNNAGEPVSDVEVIDDEVLQKQIKKQIEASEYVQQVNFW